MARPEKKTVDYFPHQTTHGKTIFILESKFGNDGYAFWFKLLETLGSKDGMFLDCDDLVEWEYFIARAKVDSETAIEVLETLASVGAISSDMWSVKIVFCQNFVDGISDAFKRRKEHLPSFDGVIAYINSAKVEKLQALTGKGKESKEKKTKEEKKGRQYGELKNVSLSDSEHAKLIDKFGEIKTASMIDNLGFYISSKGKKYKSHYATILSWSRNEKKDTVGSMSTTPPSGRFRADDI